MKVIDEQSASQGAQTSAASPPQPRRASGPTSSPQATQPRRASGATSPPSGGPTSAAQAAPSLGVFYYFLGTAALFLSLFLFYMVERITYGVCTYQGFVPVGLAILFRFRYCLGIVLLVLFALGALANRSRLLRMPVTMACAAIATLCLFFFASLLLVTPVIAVLPIDYDLDKSGPFRISKDVRLQESLANNEELLASFNDFHLTTGRQERIKSAVSIQKDCDNILCHRGIIASPDEVRRLLGEPNEIYSTAPCASNSWYYWISPESRTNGFLNIWWHTRLSKRTNRLAGIFVATFAPEESD